MYIGLFSLKNGVGCTSLSIHVANFLASNENNKVAIRELCKEGKYKTVKADFADDKTFFINDVHFYPYDVNTEPTEAFIIDDIGKIGLLHKFNKDYDKLYLCTDGSDEDLSEFLDYRNEVERITPDILLFGGSKECIHKWQNEGFKVVLIGKAREKRIPQNFAMILSTFLRTKGITPPIYHSDSVFAPVIFGNELLPDVEENITPKENTEPKPLSSKIFVKVPAPTDTYKAPQVANDDGLGITQTQIDAPNRVEKKKDTNTSETNDTDKKNDNIDKDNDVKAESTVKDFVGATKKKKEPGTVIDIVDEASDKKRARASILSSIPLKKPSIKHPFHKKNADNEENEENVDDEYVSSMLGDIPMQGVDFSFDTQLALKDLSSYSLFINKHFTCIGLNSNVRKKHYDNMDGTLLHLTRINREILQFMTEDLLSGDYVLSRFSDSEINSMRIYFDFMCSIFKREIGKTATLREYVEFKQYYNRLCETKIMLDAEENERVRMIHDIYLRYMPYAELYNVDIIPEQELLDGNIECFVSDLSFILNEHICDEDVKDVIKGLIDEIVALKPVKVVEEPSESNTIADDDEPDPNTKDTRYSTSINETSEVRALSTDDIANLPYKIRILCLNDDDSIDDSATYGLVNIERAVFTYMQKACFMKKLLLIHEDTVIPLFSSKNGGIIVPIKGDFSEDVIKIKEHIESIMSTF